MKNAKLSLSVVFLGLLVIFGLQNAELLQVNFLIWSFELRRAVLLFLVLSIGILVGWVGRGFLRSRNK